MYVRSLTGTEGEVSFPFIGAQVGFFKSWHLTRHEDNGAHEGPYVLRAVFSYVNPLLWDQPLTRQVTIRVGKKSYRLEQAPDAKTELVHQQLYMEGVSLCPHP